MIQINQINKGENMNQYLITNSKDIRDHFEISKWLIIQCLASSVLGKSFSK